jgi:hypothetical protein
MTSVGVLCESEMETFDIGWDADGAGTCMYVNRIGMGEPCASSRIALASFGSGEPCFKRFWEKEWALGRGIGFGAFWRVRGGVLRIVGGGFGIGIREGGFRGIMVVC